MKALYTFLVIFTVVLITAASCKKNANPSAGKGGTATLLIYPQHHTISKNIDTCKVYIKYNTQNTPTSYDDSTSCTCASGLVTCQFTTLRNGDYYLYGLGYDSSVQRTVGGGLYVPITSQNATTTVDLAISEL